MSYSAKSRPTSFLQVDSWSLRNREGFKDDVVGGIRGVLPAEGNVIKDAALSGGLMEDLSGGGRVAEDPDHQNLTLLGLEYGASGGERLGEVFSGCGHWAGYRGGGSHWRYIDW